ncbi:hypothetical protein GTW51_22450 [Aurantimonas aggregata]|uniref:Uncharacterized protein n=1 Tax=Aurantimonas aggregata TaxID=2047720 RepID=A0A6L9MN78_9HYPH|nr:hypothetical protein [Aurantimonas aggregata]NDV89414.1 hypothetical protein [Aurantimonas aggregata]
MLDMSEWSPDPYIVVLTGMGFLIALVAWLPLALKRLPLSLPGAHPVLTEQVA